MSPLYLAILIAFLALVLILLIGKNNTESASKFSEQDITKALNQGKRIQAIKIYRKVHGVDLKTAKEAIERIQKGESPEAAAPPLDDNEVLKLLKQGKKIAAIKVYRERYGVGLKEAKEAVEKMGR